MRRLLVPALVALSLAGFPAAGLSADGTSSQPAVVRVPVSFSHLKCEEAWVLLLSRTATTKEAVRGVKDAVVPTGIQGLVLYPLNNTLLVQGEPGAVEALKKGLALVDQPLENPAKDQVRVKLQPQWIDAALLRIAVAAIPEGGTAELTGRTVTVAGTPAWLHQALRLSIQLEAEAYRIAGSEKVPR